MELLADSDSEVSIFCGPPSDSGETVASYSGRPSVSTLRALESWGILAANKGEAGSESREAEKERRRAAQSERDRSARGDGILPMPESN